jgi:TPR repeat protein
LKPDPAEAKRWYARASDLGVSEAKARLGRLGD